MRANTRTVQNKKKHKLSLLLPFGWRAKFEGKEKKKSTALHWVVTLRPRHASICGEHGECFFHTAQLGPFIYRWYYWAGM